jgi:hypothetical protein
MQTKTSLFYLYFLSLLFINQIQAQITFSEVMYDVSTNEYHDEFIEIFNLSDRDSIDITGWTFSDSMGIDDILSYQGANKIAPRRYALILDGSYFDNSETYDSLLTDSLTILMIGDNSFGKNGLSNSKAEWLTVRDSTGRIMAEYRYSIDNKPGFSDEKINLDELLDSLNWSNSKFEGGTPGYKNSVALPLYDFGFKEQSFIFPFLIKANEPLKFSIELLNFSVKPANDSIEIIIYSDIDKNHSYHPHDLLIAHKKVPTIAQHIIFDWISPTPGEHQIIAQLYFDKDEITENNMIKKTIRVFEQEISLHINEIKFLTMEGEPEWIEFINFGKEPILLKNWAVSDLKDTTWVDSMIYIEPGDYIVLSEDTLSDFYRLDTEKMIILNKFPTLNDQEDEISLLDPTGKWIEKIHYDRQWLEGEDYRCASLERIHPLLYENKAENWGPCISPNAATPGGKNSIFSELEKSKSELTVSPNPFSPDNDGYDDVTIISGQIAEKNARIKAEIYDIRGRLIRILRDKTYNGQDFNLVWDGKDNNGRQVRMGIYIIYFQALNDRLGTIREMKTTVIVAQKL